jgi:hypothetical protein
MFVKTMSRFTFMCTFTFFISACSSLEDSKDDNTSSLFSDEQIKTYVKQWESQQDSIARLTAMEADLQLLITALSSQSELAENPQSLRQKTVDIHHSNQAIPAEKMQTAKEATTEQGESLANEQPWSQMHTLSTNTPLGAQLGWYLKPELVKNQIEKLNRDYPNAFNQFSFTMYERINNGVTLYGLRAGPFKNNDEVNLFCYLAESMGQVCSNVPFLGKAI